MINEKKCTSCGEVKHSSEFYEKSGCPGKLRSNCKACGMKTTRIWRKTNAGIAWRDRMNRSLSSRYSRARHMAGRRGIHFELSRDEYASLIEMPCRYCGDTKTPEVGCGLDRMSNDIGYVFENCVSCCEICNKAKNEFFTYDEMLILGKTIAMIKNCRLIFSTANNSDPLGLMTPPPHVKA